MPSQREELIELLKPLCAHSKTWTAEAYEPAPAWKQVQKQGGVYAQEIVARVLWTPTEGSIWLAWRPGRRFNDLTTDDFTRLLSADWSSQQPLSLIEKMARVGELEAERCE